MDPSYEPAAHTRLLVEHLEAVERGDLRRLLVFMPPRHGKTYHVSERFPAWCMGRDPSRQVILASYGAGLAERNSRAARNLVTDERWPWPEVTLADDSTAVNRWHTTQGGRVVAAGVAGGLTGYGANLLIVDDPVRGRGEADSETWRARTAAWFREVARTRLMPGGSMVVCQTRWHEADLAGQILASPGASQWTVLSMPAVAEEDDVLGRQPGEALWPAWFDAAALEEARRDLTTEQGSRAWWALYQQRPTAETGGLFRLAWLERRGLVPNPFLRIMAVDSAFKVGVGSDYSAIAVWEADQTDYGLVGLERGRWEYPDLRSAILDHARDAAPHAILIEDTASGQSIIQELQRTTGLPVVPVTVTASKHARAAAIAPLFEAGKVILAPGLPHLGAWLDEHAAFPTGAHDDLVDTTSMALAYLRDAVAAALHRARGPVVHPLRMR